MQFKKLWLQYFGRFHKKEIELHPGINIIYGENEAGKSTLHAFIKGMLFGIERARGRASNFDDYSRYLPWDNPGAFEGSMDITVGGGGNQKEYRLHRNFLSSNKSFRVIDLETGREVGLVEGVIDEIIPGLTETVYRNTVSMEQLKVATEVSLAQHLQNHIANLSIAKSKEIDLPVAIQSLSKQKRVLEKSKRSLDPQTLKEKIEEGILREEKMDALSTQLQNLLKKEQELKLLQEQRRFSQEEISQIEQFPAIEEKYSSYLQSVQQMEEMQRQYIGLEEQRNRWEREIEQLEQLEKDYNELNILQERLQDEEAVKEQLEEDYERVVTHRKRQSILLAGIPSAFFSILIIITLGWNKRGVGFLLLVGLLGYLLSWGLQRRWQHKGNDIIEQKDRLIHSKSHGLRRMEQVFQQYQVSNLEELAHKVDQVKKYAYERIHVRLQKEELSKRLEETEDRQDQLSEQVIRYGKQFIAIEFLDHDVMDRLRDEIQNKKQKEVQEQEAIKKSLEDCSLQIEKIRWELSALEENESELLRNREMYEERIKKEKEMEADLEAIQLALSTIQEISMDIHDTFGRDLNKVVAGKLKEITRGKYQDLRIDEKLNVTLGWNNEYLPLDKLSTGTIDQVYYALRLAVADLMLGEEPVPLLLDDSFAYCDDYRLGEILKQLKDRDQVILFSCHKREMQLLEDLKIPFHCITIP